jgi:uncharacterized protein (TIRG00374 family)
MWRKFLYPLLIGVLIFFLVRNWHELTELVQVLRTGSWLLILAAIFFQVLYYVFFAATYQMGMVAVGIPYKLREMVPVILSQQVVNIVTGGAGMVGTMLLVDDARRRGATTALRGVAGYLLSLMCDYTGIMISLVIGFGYVFWRRDLPTYQIAATSILLGLIILINLAFVLAATKPRALATILHALTWVIDKVRKLFHRSAKGLGEWVESVISEFKIATETMRNNPTKVRELIFFALFSHLVNITCLQLLFLAFGQPVDVGTLIAGYAVGKLFLVISITPQGLGVVEGAMTLVFAKLGIPTPTAVVVVLAFRGMNLWLPVIVGAITLRKVRGFHNQLDSEEIISA